MIYDSNEWKQELLIKKRQLNKFNNSKKILENYDLACHKIESALFYSAFIIRKLMESNKLSDMADAMPVPCIQFKPLKSIHRFNNHVDNEKHDFKNPLHVINLGKDVCNWLIHSYIFQLIEDNGIFVGFLVSSDYDRNKYLTEISLKDWTSFIDFIIGDNVVDLHARKDPNKNDFIFLEKIRG